MYTRCVNTTAQSGGVVSHFFPVPHFFPVRSTFLPFLKTYSKSDSVLPKTNQRLYDGAAEKRLIQPALCCEKAPRHEHNRERH
jgi:hypothetical protein